MRLESLTAEWRLLVACAAQGPDPGAVRGLLGDDLDWPALIDRAVRHGLAPLLCATLRAAAIASPPGPPEAILTRLGELYERHAGRHAGRVAKLAEIGAELDGAGIPFIVLKGAALGSVVYRDPTFRTMGDVDLLTRREDLAAASRALRRLGYTPDESWHTEAWYAAHHQHLAPLVAQDGSLIVEIHGSILEPGGARVPVDVLWERAGLERIGSARFRVFAPSDLLFHQCLHLAHDNLFIDGKLRDLRDMAETVRHYGDAVDWDAVVGQARTWQISRYVYWSLWLARDLVGAAIPAAVLAQLADAHRARRTDALLRRLLPALVLRLGPWPFTLPAWLMVGMVPLLIHPDPPGHAVGLLARRAARGGRMAARHLRIALALRTRARRAARRVRAALSRSAIVARRRSLEDGRGDPATR